VKRHCGVTDIPAINLGCQTKLGELRLIQVAPADPLRTAIGANCRAIDTSGMALQAGTGVKTGHFGRCHQRKNAIFQALP